MPAARPTGFSLIELLMALAVLSILAAIAAPSLAGLLDARRVDAVLHRLAIDISYTRFQAARLGRRVELQLEWAPEGLCIRRYRVRPAEPSASTLRQVEVAELLPRGCLRANSPTKPIAFGSRGLPSGLVTRTITARSGAAEDTLVVSQLGRIRR